MSTAMTVSAFYDVGDVLYQNRKSASIPNQNMEKTRRIIVSTANLSRSQNLNQQLQNQPLQNHQMQNQQQLQNQQQMQNQQLQNQQIQNQQQMMNQQLHNQQQMQSQQLTNQQIQNQQQMQSQQLTNQQIQNQQQMQSQQLTNQQIQNQQQMQRQQLTNQQQMQNQQLLNQEIQNQQQMQNQQLINQQIQNQQLQSNNNNVYSNVGSPILGRDSAASPTPQMKKLDRSISEPIGNSTLQRQDSQKQPQNINTSRYKTELCRCFEESGHCKYGDKCQFAHGKQELRSLSRHPKYKTELCRTFHTVGFCPYGPRCHFVHEDLSQLHQMNDKNTGSYPPSPNQSPPAGTQVSQHAVSGPTPINRPKALNFSYSVPANSRDSIGSAGNSPASSISSDSPSGSPNSMLIEDFLNATQTLTNNAINQHINNQNNNKLRIAEEDIIAANKLLLSSISPLNIQTVDPLLSLAATLKTLKLSQCLNNRQIIDESLYSLLRDNEFQWAPPSPPESLSSGDSGWSSNMMNVDDCPCTDSTCDTPLDVSRGLRLPIFSQFTRE